MSTSLTIEKGSRVLITGATGLVGSATLNEVIKQGYSARITTRNPEKAKPLVEKIAQLYPNASVELVHVSDLGSRGALTEALQGISGVLHIAADTSWGTDTEKLVQDVIQATLNVLESAASTPTVKSVVLTSSRVAIWAPAYGTDVLKVDAVNGWNEDVVKLAYQVPQDHPAKAGLTYATSKVRQEQEAWKWYDTTKPNFQFSTVLPDYIIGPIFNPAREGTSYSTASWLIDVFQGATESPAITFSNPPSLSIDVRDVATIHVAALLDKDAAHKRIIAAAHRYTFDAILAIWREAYPENKKIPADFNFPKGPYIDVDLDAGRRLIKKWSDRTDYFSLKEAALANVQEL